jgi:hypothetical protein
MPPVTPEAPIRCTEEYGYITGTLQGTSPAENAVVMRYNK